MSDRPNARRLPYLILADRTVLNEADRNFAVGSTDQAGPKKRKVKLTATPRKASAERGCKTQPQVLFRSPSTREEKSASESPVLDNNLETIPTLSPIVPHSVQPIAASSNNVPNSVNDQVLQRVSALERDLRVSNSMNDQVLQRVSALERDLRVSNAEIVQLKADVATLQNKSRQSNQRIVPMRPPNLNDIPLLHIDIVPLHEGDTEVPKYHLSEVEQLNVKQSSKTQRRFIAQLTRMMYSIYERAQNVNVAGKHQREKLSPGKTRFQRIASYTAHTYHVNCNEPLLREVRVVIDETNRRYREDLRMRKYRAQVRNEMNQENA